MVSVILHLIFNTVNLDEVPAETRYPNLVKNFKRDGKRLRSKCSLFVGRILQPNEIKLLEKDLKLVEPKPLDSVSRSWLMILSRPESISGLPDIYMIEGTSNSCLFHCKRAIPGLSGDDGKVFLSGKWTAEAKAYYMGNYILWKQEKKRKLTMRERLSLAYYLGLSKKLKVEPTFPQTLISFSTGGFEATINDLGTMTIGSYKGQLEHREWAQVARIFNLLR